MEKINSKRWIFWLVGVIILIAIVVLSTTTGHKKQTAEGPYKIGAALALSGDAAAWGESELKAIKIAVQEINDKGGVEGRTFDLVIEDTKSDSKGSVNALQKLLSIDHVDAVIGPTWFDSYPGGASEMKEYPNRILVTPSASIDVVNENKQYNNVFSTFTRPKIQAELLGQYMKGLGDKKIAILFQNDAYFQEFAANFEKGYGDDSRIVSSELVNYGDSIKPVLLKISRTHPDIILFGLYDQAQIYGFLKDRSIYFKGAEIYSNDNAENYLSYEDIKKDSLGGITYITSKDPAKSFIDKFTKAHNTPPKYSASSAYDAVYVVKDFLQNGSDPQKLRGKSIDTVSFGKTQFDDYGGISTDLKPYCIRKIDPSSGESITIKCW